jgi:hypothetical protein
MLKSSVKSAQKGKATNGSTIPSSEDPSDPIVASPPTFQIFDRPGSTNQTPQVVDPRQQAALRTWKHAERVSQDLTPPIGSVLNTRPTQELNNRPRPSPAEVDRLRSDISSEVSTVLATQTDVPPTTLLPFDARPRPNPFPPSDPDSAAAVLFDQLQQELEQLRESQTHQQDMQEELSRLRASHSQQRDQLLRQQRRILELQRHETSSSDPINVSSKDERRSRSPGSNDRHRWDSGSRTPPLQHNSQDPQSQRSPRVTCSTSASPPATATATHSPRAQVSATAHVHVHGTAATPAPAPAVAAKKKSVITVKKTDRSADGVKLAATYMNQSQA